jgi:hypothetical protein
MQALELKDRVHATDYDNPDFHYFNSSHALGDNAEFYATVLLGKNKAKNDKSTTPIRCIVDRAIRLSSASQVLLTYPSESRAGLRPRWPVRLFFRLAFARPAYTT